MPIKPCDYKQAFVQLFTTQVVKSSSTVIPTTSASAWFSHNTRAEGVLVLVSAFQADFNFSDIYLGDKKRLKASQWTHKWTQMNLILAPLRRFNLQKHTRLSNATVSQRDNTSPRWQCIKKAGWLFTSSHERKKVKLYQKSIFSNLFSCPSLLGHHHNTMTIRRHVSHKHTKLQCCKQY